MGSRSNFFTPHGGRMRVDMRRSDTEPARNWQDRGANSAGACPECGSSLVDSPPDPFEVALDRERSAPAYLMTAPNEIEASLIAGRLRKAGVKPLGDDNTYFQRYEMHESRVDTAQTWLEVNGKRFQDGSTATMVYRPAFLVSYLSQFMSLLPGDVIYTGTPGTTKAMKPGDVVEVELLSVPLLLHAAWQEHAEAMLREYLLVSLDELGVSIGGGVGDVLHAPYGLVHDWEEAVHHATGAAGGVLGWLVNTALSAVVGLVIGGIILALMHVLPFGKKHGAAAH